MPAAIRDSFGPGFRWNRPRSSPETELASTARSRLDCLARQRRRATERRRPKDGAYLEARRLWRARQSSLDRAVDASSVSGDDRGRFQRKPGPNESRIAADIRRQRSHEAAEADQHRRGAGPNDLRSSTLEFHFERL